MSQNADRNDEVLAIFQAKTPEALPLVTEEPFAAQAPAEIGVPVRALTVEAGGAPLALIGITSPSITPQAAGFVASMARRGACPSRFLVGVEPANVRHCLVRTPRRDGDALDILRSYPTEHSILPNATDALLRPRRAYWPIWRCA